jgi:chromosome partitioning protein
MDRAPGVAGAGGEAMAGRIVAVAQQKGGSGKTTVAAHLAVALAARGLSVAVLDVDPQGSLGEWYELRERRLGEPETGLVFRTASGWGAKREARALARDHDVVVVDTPPKSDLEARHAIESADLVAVPVQPTAVDLWATRPTLEMVERGGPPAVLVINRVPPRGAASTEVIAALSELGAPAAATRLGNRVAFSTSMGEGATASETARGTRAAEEAEALAAEIARLMGAAG